VTQLPAARGLIVAYDTEASGLSAEDGARICSLSVAWRDPASRKVQAIAVPFDMGFDHSPWLGPKQLPPDHADRLAALMVTHGRDHWDVVNRGEREWLFIMDWLRHQRLVMHNATFDCQMTSAGVRDHPGLGVDLEPHLHWDTKLAQGVLEPEEGTSLKPTSVRHHVGKELGFAEGMESAEQEALAPWKGAQPDPRYDLIPWRVLAPYAIVDAQLTLLLAEWQWQQLDERADSARLRQQVSADLDFQRLLYLIERFYRPRAQLIEVGHRGQARAGRRGSARAAGTRPRPSQQNAGYQSL
jgi:hypothetical protein